MNNKNKLLTLVIIMVVVIGIAAVGYNKLSGKYKEESGQTGSQEAGSEDNTKTKAPDFTALDVDGKEVKMSDLAGKPMVINFWASWCGPCQSELPDFDEAYKKYGNKIEFMMVNLTDGGRETVEKVEKFIGNGGYTFPVYYDTEFDAAKAYGVSTIPVTYFVDADGNIVDSYMGSMNQKTLESYLDSLLNSK